MTGKEFADVVSRFMNNMNDEPKKEAIQYILRDHPTLQQGIMRFFMGFVEGMAEKEYVDARNQDSKRLANEILKIEDRHLPFI